MNGRLQILVADDHVAVREGIRQIVEHAPDLQVHGMASTLSEVISALKTQRFDVVILDLSLGEGRPADMVASVRATRDDVPLLVYTMYPEDEFAARLFSAGISGYVTKDAPPETLVDAIRKVGRGGRYVSAKLGELLAAEAGRRSRPRHVELSDRELQVLVMTAEGKSLKEIGLRLGVSLKTVSTYRTRTLQKLDLTNNADLIRYAILNGLTGR